MKDEDLTLNVGGAGRFATGAVIDVQRRNDAAYEKYAEFFDDPEHGARVDAARKILEDFFPVKDLYENQRTGKGKPFTVLKVTNHMFPRVSLSTKAKRYRRPLEELGVVFVQSKGTNSLLYRIY